MAGPSASAWACIGLIATNVLPLLFHLPLGRSGWCWELNSAGTEPVPNPGEPPFTQTSVYYSEVLRHPCSVIGDCSNISHWCMIGYQCTPGRNPSSQAKDALFTTSGRARDCSATTTSSSTATTSTTTTIAESDGLAVWEVALLVIGSVGGVALGASSLFLLLRCRRRQSDLDRASSEPSPVEGVQEQHMRDWLEGHDFYFLDARALMAVQGALPNFQCFIRSGQLQKRRLSFHDMVEQRIKDSVAVSHIWLEANHPDSRGEQLGALQAYLAKNKHVKWLWIDWCCLPQAYDETGGSTRRTEEEKAIFLAGLQKVNMVYLSLPVIIILDSTYLSRFWPQFEAFLSFQRVTRIGLVPSTGRRALRSIFIFTGISAGSGESQRRLVAECQSRWAGCSVADAIRTLSASDVLVTNLGDKTTQLDKLKQLQVLVAILFANASSKPHPSTSTP